MPTLIQRLEARLSVSPMSDFDRETISQALELARAEQYRVDREAEQMKNLEGAREQALAQLLIVRSTKMSTLIQRLEARLSVSPMSDFDRETISQALELARAEQIAQMKTALEDY